MNYERANSSYISEKAGASPRPEKGGYGVFARQPIAAGELIIVWGGDIVSFERLAEMPEEIRMHSVQVEEGLYLIGHHNRPAEEADFINHSCEPNTGLRGQIALVALRDIPPGEEICIDYAMCDGSPYDEFSCACGALSCRGRVSGDDWKNPVLQQRYAGYFSPYLQRRIDGLNSNP